MEYYDLIQDRYSVRSYKPDPIPEDKLKKILEAAVYAPTTCNLQSFKIIVIKTKGHEEALKKIYTPAWFSQAPLVICACGFPAKNWSRSDGKNYNDVDVAIAMDHLILAATNEGLGTCWIGAFNPSELRSYLNLPIDVNPVALSPLGYPNDAPGPKLRKKFEEIIEIRD